MIMNAIVSNNTGGRPRRGPTIMVPALWASGENSGRPLTAEEQALLAVISTVVRFRKGGDLRGGRSRRCRLQHHHRGGKVVPNAARWQTAHRRLSVSRRFDRTGSKRRICKLSGGGDRRNPLQDTEGSA